MGEWRELPGPPIPLNTTLLVRTEEDLEDERDFPAGVAITLHDDLHFTIVCVSLDDGRTALPAFTDEDELLAYWPEGGPYIAMSLSDVLPLMEQSEADLLVIDPASPSPVLVTRGPT